MAWRSRSRSNWRSGFPVTLPGKVEVKVVPGPRGCCLHDQVDAITCGCLAPALRSRAPVSRGMIFSLVNRGRMRCLGLIPPCGHHIVSWRSTQGSSSLAGMVLLCTRVDRVVQGRPLWSGLRQDHPMSSGAVQGRPTSFGMVRGHPPSAWIFCR